MSRIKGDRAEEQAAEYLRTRGFRIVDRNVSSRFGEIDIIAMKGEVLHFVEVKSAPTYEQAVANVTPAKLAKILKTAHTYMKKHHLDLDYSFDALIVSGGQCELIENVTM